MNACKYLLLLSCLVAQVCGAASLNSAHQDKPVLESELIFPLERWHNHASCIVETPNGDLLVCWFHGSGERTADDEPVSVLTSDMFWQGNAGARVEN